LVENDDDNLDNMAIQTKCTKYYTICREQLTDGIGIYKIYLSLDDYYHSDNKFYFLYKGKQFKIDLREQMKSQYYESEITFKFLVPIDHNDIVIEIVEK
jgi:hypothetical protein